MSLKHTFVSAKADPADASIVAASHWNATHLFNPDGSAFQYLRKQGNLTSPDYEFATIHVKSSDHDFPAQSPGGSLTASITNTVTLTPVPQGVNGTDVNHYLYISGGVGTAEAVLITGGTAVSGAASGTVTFVPANNHSGAWTIKSATAGIQEAISVLPADGGLVKLPNGTLNIYGSIYIGEGSDTVRSLKNSICVVGEGGGRSAVMAFPTTGGTTLLWGGATGGTVVIVRGPVGNCLLEGFYIDGNGTAAIGLDIKHSYLSTYRRIGARNWTSVGIRSQAIDAAFVSMVNGNNENIFDTCTSDDNVTSASAVCFQVGQSSAPSVSVFAFSSNLVMNCYFHTVSGIAAEIRYADHNLFLMTTFNGSSGVGALKMTAVGANFPNSNLFIHCPMVGLLSANPTTFSPVYPNFFFPLTVAEYPQNPATYENFAYGFESQAKWFGRQKNIPLHYSLTASSAAIASTVAETAFNKSFTIEPRRLDFSGAICKIRASGRYSTTGVPTLLVKVKLDSVIIGQFTLTCLNNAAAFSWSAEAEFNIGVIGAGGSGLRGYAIGGTNTLVGNDTNSGFSVNTTVNQIVTVTAQWGTSSASNTITMDHLTVEIMYPGLVGL